MRIASYVALTVHSSIIGTIETFAGISSTVLIAD